MSISKDASFCVEALEEAFSKYGMPEIFNSDQGGQFTRPGQSGLGGRHHVHPDGLRLGQLVRDRRARSSPGR